MRDKVAKKIQLLVPDDMLTGSRRSKKRFWNSLNTNERAYLRKEMIKKEISK